MSFDLDAYLARIGLPARVTLDADGLKRLQLSHRLAIPFENLDIALGRGIAIDGEAVFAKLVMAKRGGYCFEHNRLFRDALDALGFAARPLLARVWLDVVEPPPLTHTLSLVTIDGAEWIGDAGFGASYGPPMPLAEGAVAVAPDGARFTLSRDERYGWMLWREGHHGSTDGRGATKGPVLQYSFTTAPVEEADMLLGNHWTSTAAAARLVRHRIVSIVLPRGFAGLTDTRYHRRAGDDEQVAVITDPRVYRLRLSLMFGLDLSEAEVAQLGLFA